MSPAVPEPDAVEPTSERAAFEVTVGAQTFVSLSGKDVAAHLEPAELFDALEDAFRSVELGEVQSPPRPQITVPDRGFSLAMPAWRAGLPIGVKVVNVFDGNLAVGLPNHLATILLFDPDTGAMLAVIDGTYITGVRTAAAAVLSARLLSRSDARVATVIGAGVQGREHLRLLPLVRTLEQIHVCSLEPAHADRLAGQSPLATATADVEAAVRASDIVCLATHSPTAVIDPAWVRPGTHVTSVGYHPPAGELPGGLVAEHRVFVETLDALAAAPVGCSELAGADPDRVATLGAVSLGRAPGRTSDDEITVYKAMGLAIEDLVAADLAYRRSLAGGTGQRLSW